MSLHYLLDGYNISNQLPIKSLDKLEDQRKNLVSFIERNRPQGSVRNKVTIVFDGRAGIEYQQMSVSVEVVFSKDEIADNKIRSIVEKARNKKNIIVVTDDREIQYAVKANGAKVLSVKDFLAQGNKSQASRTSNRKRSSKNEKQKRIPRVIEFQITSEMKKIWLDKK